MRKFLQNYYQMLHGKDDLRAVFFELVKGLITEHHPIPNGGCFYGYDSEGNDIVLHCFDNGDLFMASSNGSIMFQCERSVADKILELHPDLTEIKRCSQ